MAPEPPKKRRKISPTGESSSETLLGSPMVSSKPFIPDAFYANASRWNLEQNYESKARKLKKKEKYSARLPIKHSEGRIEQVKAPKNDDEEVDSWLDSEEASEVEAAPVEVQEPQKPSREQIIEAKQELSRLAFLVNQDPEEHAGAFKKLSQIAESKNITVKKLALATQMTVFKDVIPGYRIRPLTDKDMTEKVSKEVKRRQAFEQGLVRSYQTYVNELTKCAKSRMDANLEKIAISCACELVLAVPHFNFRGELLKILVNKLSHKKIDDDFIKCRETLETVFDEDEDGHASLDAVTILTRMVKARNYNIDESVLDTLLHLRLLTEFSSKASKDEVDKPAAQDGKKPKQKREFRSKKKRKALRELKSVEKDFAEADAVVSHEERDRKQAETLKLVFVTYFKILKARSPHLTGAVLEGLAKFAHLINQDFFGDLLEVLKELAHGAARRLEPAVDIMKDEEQVEEAMPSDPARTALLCTTTAFALLSAQDVARLSLDLSSFSSLLYALLLPALSLQPDLELSHKTLRLADPHASTSSDALAAPKINIATTSTLLLRALAAALTPRSTPPTRLASFTHRLLIASLHTPEKTTWALLALLGEIVRSQGRKVSPLWHSEERRGDGEFDPLGDMENCRPYCGSAWEDELLRWHFSEGVRQGVGELEGLVAGLA